ncbi:hypothetical protein ACJX0J_036369 [Zea mays]
MHLIILVFSFQLFSGHLAKGGVFGINQEGLGKNIHNGLLLTNIQQIFMTTKRRTVKFKQEFSLAQPIIWDRDTWKHNMTKAAPHRVVMHMPHFYKVGTIYEYSANQSKENSHN